MDPLATQWVRGYDLLLMPFQITDWNLSNVQEFIHFRGVPSTPTALSFPEGTMYQLCQGQRKNQKPWPPQNPTSPWQLISWPWRMPVPLQLTYPGEPNWDSVNTPLSSSQASKASLTTTSRTLLCVFHKLYYSIIKQSFISKIVFIQAFRPYGNGRLDTIQCFCMLRANYQKISIVLNFVTCINRNPLIIIDIFFIIVIKIFCSKLIRWRGHSHRNLFNRFWMFFNNFWSGLRFCWNFVIFLLGFPFRTDKYWGG